MGKLSAAAAYERRQDRRHEQFVDLLAEAERCIEGARFNFARPNGSYGAPCRLLEAREALRKAVELADAAEADYRRNRV
jgi:hypothetical protein